MEEFKWSLQYSPALIILWVSEVFFLIVQNIFYLITLFIFGSIMLPYEIAVL